MYPPLTQQSSRSPTRYKLAGFATGSDVMRIPCTKVKIAVFAPMPRAIVNTTVAVNPGNFSNCRNAIFKSCISPNPPDRRTAKPLASWTEPAPISERSRQEDSWSPGLPRPGSKQAADRGDSLQNGPDAQSTSPSASIPQRDPKPNLVLCSLPYLAGPAL